MRTEAHIESHGRIGFTAGPEASLRNRVCDHLKHEVLDRWFPACIDTAVGGFHQNFDRDWTRGPGSTRSLVFQSRMTWVAAEASNVFHGEREQYLSIARFGLNGLRKHLADAEQGGYYFATDPPGRPRQQPDIKHAYGMAFVIYAASAAALAGVSDDATTMAVDAFNWLIGNAWDHEHGGCHEALQRSGKPVMTASGTTANDAIGSPIGHKTMNTHIHLLEAFTVLYRVWPDPVVRDKIEAIQSLITDIMWAEPGSLHTIFTPDWNPLTADESFGHNVETGYLLVESMDALGHGGDEPTWRRARALVDHALDTGWDTEHGGFFDSGDGHGNITDDTKTWWVQAEGLNALCLMHKRFGRQTDRYLKLLQQQWSFIADHQTDPEHGGWFGYLSPDGLHVLDGGVKASEWKTAYHNARALMNVIRLLEPGSK